MYSLQIKNNRYYAVIDQYDECGKRKQRWINTELSVDGNNKRKAEKFLRETIKQQEDGKVAYSKNVLFADWLGEWLEMMKDRVELCTWESYECYVRVHLIPYFKKTKILLTNLTPKHIQDYYTKKRKDGRSDGKGGLSANSVKKHGVMIHSALEEALKLNLIPYNPSDRTTLPKIENKFVGNFYNEAQAQVLLKDSRGTTLETVIILTLYYGLRRSEVCGLHWNAIDFDRDTMIIKNTVVRHKTLVEKERTKNKSSYRTLPLLPDVKKYLKALKIKQAEMQLLFGADYNKNDYVCKWDNGNSLKPDYISRKFVQISTKAGLPRIRFHDLRHSTASILIAMGFNLKEIQEWLGHANISTTSDGDFRQVRKTDFLN